MSLSESIHLFGNLLGEVLREQESAELFEIEEAIRIAAKNRRADNGDAEASLIAKVASLAPEEARVVAAAFALYFDLVNLAEEYERIVRLRDRERRAHPGVPSGSIGHAVQMLHENGVTGDEMQAILDHMQIELVLTAHPTEAKRRTLLSKMARISELLQDYHRPETLPRETESIQESLYAEITNFWLTARQRTTRPLVSDEAKTALFFFEEVFWITLPRIYADLENALAHYYPGVSVRHSWLTIASWVGGDRDGNPFVTPEVTADTLRMHRGLAITQHRDNLRPLARRLSPSEDRLPPPAELEDWLSTRREMAEHLAFLARRYPNEPYRLAISALVDDLDQAAQEHVKEVLLGHGEHSPSLSLQAIVAPLEMAARSFPAVIREDHLAVILRQLHIFGLHAGRLDIREDSSVLREALGEIFRALNIAPDFESLSPDERLELLNAWMDRVPPGLSTSPGVTAITSRTWALFQLIGRAKAIYGPDTLGPFIISMTKTAADVLTVLLLARWAGCDQGLSIAPLFETVDDLNNAPDVLQRLFDLPVYRQHLSTCGDKQMVMIGYSDSNKDGGYLAANWALYQGQEKIAATCRANSIELTLFHGRGGTVARGGGPANRAIRAQPPGTVNGRFRMTVQGEVISSHYGNPQIAHRNLEQMVHAVLLASVPGSEKDRAPKRWREAMEEMADVARRTYRALVYETPGFLYFWQHATPLDEISRLRIGSRPASRPGAKSAPEQGLQVFKIRAIPWVFSWMQSRYNLPGWFGLGTGLEDVEDRNLLQEMYSDWPFFQAIVDNTEMSLLKADMGIASHYTELVPDRELAANIFGQVRDEYSRTKDAVLRITGHQALMDTDPTIQKSIHLRNPYVDPLNFLQIDMLRQIRGLENPDGSEAAALREVLVMTINGIAAGLRNTG